MSNPKNASGSAEEDKKNWPAIIWRIFVRSIPFILLIYYFTYEPAVEESAPQPPAVVADSTVVDSLR